ncbi:receptor-transporting protein 3-like [Rana temporaria]|uniref:receptor-transporting protein 3-like n=1 Tax=Rana temporaria TaxID=8407 RepID=UPI001AACDE8A|nr:receptor-transporting protein 3-like [Rana temporaria]
MDEDTWKSIFENDLVSRGVSDVWNFSVDEHYQERMGWLQYVQCCYARFRCSICGRSWGSSKVHIFFHMSLKRRTGEVRMYVCKQKCKKCTAAMYEEPTFLVENIEIAIGNLVNKITQKFYNLPIDNLPRNFVTDGMQDGPHDYINCEGCALGICKYYTDIQYSDKRTFLPKTINQGSKQKKKRFPRSNINSRHQGSLQYLGSGFLDGGETGGEQIPWWIVLLILLVILWLTSHN